MDNIYIKHFLVLFHLHSVCLLLLTSCADYRFLQHPAQVMNWNNACNKNGNKTEVFLLCCTLVLLLFTPSLQRNTCTICYYYVLMVHQHMEMATRIQSPLLSKVHFLSWRGSSLPPDSVPAQYGSHIIQYYTLQILENETPYQLFPSTSL